MFEFLKQAKYMETILQAPTINERKILPPLIIEEITRRIVTNFNPIKIILFGSYAYGEPKPESDIDILVVMNTELSEIQQAQAVRKIINPLFGLDLIVYKPENLEKRIRWGDPFLKEILEKGIKLYESNNP